MYQDLIGHFITETIDNKGKAIPFVEFVLELDPMQTQSVQETLHRIHA